MKHGLEEREFDRAEPKTGRYGRMFPVDSCPPCPEDSQPDPKFLGPLLQEGSDSPENRSVEAGYTFLGQFIDHDITFDPTSLHERNIDPHAVWNFRTPALDLDSVYGGGPLSMPYLYDPDPGNYGRFLLGKDSDPYDVSRDRKEQAIIGDPRNDQTLIISQLHFALLQFHNRALERVRETQPRLSPRQRFEEARRLVRYHYQWIVRHEYLPKICRGDVVDHIVENGRIFYRYEDSQLGEPFIPVEFSAAAFRFGHSQVKSGYSLNPGFARPLFSADGDDLRGGRELNAWWLVYWSFFFYIDEDRKRNRQFSNRIDTMISDPLHDLPDVILPPGEPGSRGLAVRTLQRAINWGLPCGNDIARHMKITLPEPFKKELKVLEEKELWGELHGEIPAGRRDGPLWYYVLREAEEEEGGACLGIVGSWIVAEVLLGILEAAGRPKDRDPAILSIDWTPEKEAWFDEAREEPTIYTMADLLRFAGVRL